MVSAIHCKLRGQQQRRTTIIIGNDNDDPDRQSQFDIIIHIYTHTHMQTIHKLFYKCSVNNKMQAREKEMERAMEGKRIDTDNIFKYMRNRMNRLYFGS